MNMIGAMASMIVAMIMGYSLVFGRMNPLVYTTNAIWVVVALIVAFFVIAIAFVALEIAEKKRRINWQVPV